MLFRNKGQAFVPDFMASVAIFGFILVVFMTSWNALVDNQLQSQRDQDLYIQGQRTMNQLINSEGVPKDWNSSSVDAVGLAEQPHVLNGSKMSELEELSYSRQQSLMKAVGGFQLSVKGAQNYEVGEEPDADTVFSFTRFALLNQSGDLKRVEVKYAVW
jgi:hypothetical protein